MQSKSIVSTKIFSASILLATLSLILHPPFLPLGIPAPYAPFLIYQIWEIPLFIALFLFGPISALLASFINFISLLIFFPGQLITGPIYNLFAIYSSFIGIILIHNLQYFRIKKNLVILTSSAIIIRTSIMTIINFIALPMNPPIGFAIPESALFITLGLIALFNATLIAYTVPISYIISNIIKKTIQIKTWI